MPLGRPPRSLRTLSEQAKPYVLQAHRETGEVDGEKLLDWQFESACAAVCLLCRSAERLTRQEDRHCCFRHVRSHLTNCQRPSLVEGWAGKGIILEVPATGFKLCADAVRLLQAGRRCCSRLKAGLGWS